MVWLRLAALWQTTKDELKIRLLTALLYARAFMSCVLEIKNVMVAMALLATGCAMAADPLPATNLVFNGGFEQGGAGWVFSANGAKAGGGVVTNQAHSGQNSFWLENASGFAPNVFARVTQVVTGLEPFTTYRISCF